MVERGHLSYRSTNNTGFVRIGTSAAAAEMIRTGSTFAADMYFFPAVTGGVLTDAGLRGLIGGPVSDAALPSHDDAESALSELDQPPSPKTTRRIWFSMQ